jgi:hypothetical protein
LAKELGYWIKERTYLHITLPSEHKLIKDGLKTHISIRGARAFCSLDKVVKFFYKN